MRQRQESAEAWRDRQNGCGIGFGYKPLPDAERGFEGAEIGLKFGLIPGLFALSASGSFGDKAYGINGILSKGFGPVGCDLNLGMTATADTNDADLTYGLCCHFDGEKFCAGAEIGVPTKALIFGKRAAISVCATGVPLMLG
jgi:hypothetical protein